VREQRVTEDMLQEIRSVCEAAATALQKRDELRNLMKVPEGIG
jgi:hypothetical protein